MIRDAIPADVPQLIALGRLMAIESPRYSRLTYSPEKLDRLFRSLIESPDGYLVLAEQRGEIVGVMAGVVTDHWMAEERIATDFGVFVRADSRRGGDAACMVRGFVEWAIAAGAAEIDFGISTGIEVEQTARFYHRLGLRQFGLMFEVPHVHP